MDYQKITEVPTATALTGNESIYIRQGDTFRRVSIADFWRPWASRTAMMAYPQP